MLSASFSAQKARHERAMDEALLRSVFTEVLEVCRMSYELLYIYIFIQIYIYINTYISTY